MKDQILAACDSASALLQSPTNPPQRILVVDDDGDIRRLVAEALIQSGYEVDAAKDGAVAWDNLQLNSYDLMVTDNRMPKVTGVDLLKKLRVARMALPVIMATGRLPEAEFTRYPWLQPAATLVKPYTIPELLGTVKKVLREADGIADGAQVFMSRDRKDNKISQAGEPAVASRQRPAHSAHRILVVDEDSDLRRLYTEVLVRPGYHVDVAEDGAVGWDTLQLNSYSLLIIDNTMPKLTGVGLLKKLRAARMALPVIMATATLPAHEFAQSPWLIPDATLVKPYTVGELLWTVKEVLRANDSVQEQIAPRAGFPVTTGAVPSPAYLTERLEG